MQGEGLNVPLNAFWLKAIKEIPCSSMYHNKSVCCHGQFDIQVPHFETGHLILELPEGRPILEMDVNLAMDMQ